jgi:hypothetical protein
MKNLSPFFLLLMTLLIGVFLGMPSLQEGDDDDSLNDNAIGMLKRGP